VFGPFARTSTFALAATCCRTTLPSPPGCNTWASPPLPSRAPPPSKCCGSVPCPSIVQPVRVCIYTHARMSSCRSTCVTLAKALPRAFATTLGQRLWGWVLYGTPWYSRVLLGMVCRSDPMLANEIMALIFGTAELQVLSAHACAQTATAARNSAQQYAWRPRRTATFATARRRGLPWGGTQHLFQRMVALVMAGDGAAARAIRTAEPPVVQAARVRQLPASPRPSPPGYRYLPPSRFARSPRVAQAGNVTALEIFMAEARVRTRLGRSRCLCCEDASRPTPSLPRAYLLTLVDPCSGAAVPCDYSRELEGSRDGSVSGSVSGHSRDR
jgi:hypothetical protein